MRIGRYLVDGVALVREALPRVRNPAYQQEIEDFLAGRAGMPSQAALRSLEMAVLEVAMLGKPMKDKQ